MTIGSDFKNIGCIWRSRPNSNIAESMQQV